MDELQQFFRDSVVDQARALEQLVGLVAAGDPDSIELVRRIAHSLKGSGASYGYPEISDAAIQLAKVEDEDLSAAVSELCIALGAVTSSASRKLILVVDDDPLITRLLEARLTTPGRRVTSMTSLEAARQFLAQSRPDLILLDLFLPDGDGRTLLTEIRHTDHSVSTPVIVISGTEESAIAEQAMALGANQFVRKPFLADEVVARVSDILRDNESPATGRAALTASYRALLEREVPISVVAVVPETHGPGGKSADGPDRSVAAEVYSAIVDLLGPDADMVTWAEGEIAIVTAQDPTDLGRVIDRARTRLRNQQHPTVEGALVSFSAGIVSDDGRGLSDAYHRAHRFALDANMEGGDRVMSGRAVRRAGRVLLAEDDTLTAALVIHRLEREGFDVVHESDGKSALDSAVSEDFAVIILDVAMPGMNGFDILERLRTMRSLDETPIVMLTAAGGERDVVRGFDLGANDYIVKPFSPAELTARIKRFVKP
jgi:DNA-binding response OmpR family regulator